MRKGIIGKAIITGLAIVVLGAGMMTGCGKDNSNDNDK